MATSNNSEAGQINTSLGIYILLLLALFATELAVMELLSAWLPTLPVILAGLLDAAVLVLLLAWPLWFLIVREPGERTGASAKGRSGASVKLLLLILGSIFLVEFLVMLIYPSLLPLGQGPRETRGVVDAGLTILFCAPLLWWLLSRPEARQRNILLSELLGTPLGLYVLLLVMVFLVDLLQDHLTLVIFPQAPDFSAEIAHSLVTTLVLAPLLWLLVAWPLRRAAQSEKTRAWAIHAQLIDAVVITDAQGRIEAFNPAAERIFGYSAAAMAGQHSAHLFTAEGPGFETLVRSADEGGDDRNPPQIHELAGNRLNGTTLTLEVSISKVVLGGRQEFLLIMRDISDRKEMERALRESKERFRQIFEQSDDAIVFFKPGSCAVIDVNHTTVLLFGFDSDEIKARGMEAMIAPADLPWITTAISRLRPGETPQFDYIRGRRRDGAEFVLSIRGKVMTLRGVDIVQCTFRDVTERVRMEQEAREIQSQLIKTNKMTSLGLMVSGVAHEINNPNNFIMANAQLLARTWTDARKILREYQGENGDFLLGGIPFSEIDANSPQLFAGIIDGTRRINEIINNLKGFARQDRVVTDAPVDVNQVVTSAVSILRHELVRFTDRFHLELTEPLPRVRGSSQQLGQVVINLLMNACQALPARTFGIRLTTAAEKATGQVVIAVQDEGRGMTTDDSRRIMEPFFTTKLDTGGTGLGLSICMSIVKEHHGTLEFISEPGKGTTFFVKLPTEAPAQGEEPHGPDQPDAKTGIAGR